MNDTIDKKDQVGGALSTFFIATVQTLIVVDGHIKHT